MIIPALNPSASLEFGRSLVSVAVALIMAL